MVVLQKQYLLNLLMALSTYSFPLFMKRDDKSTVLYNLVTQIGDGQIQAPMESNTLQAIYSSSSSESSTIPSSVSSTTTFESSESAQHISSVSNTPSFSESLPAPITGTPYRLTPSSSLNAYHSNSVTSTSTSSLVSSYSSFSQSTSITPSPNRTKNSYDLVTQIGDGQIQAPASSSPSSLASTFSVSSASPVPISSAPTSSVLPSTTPVRSSNIEANYSTKDDDDKTLEPIVPTVAPTIEASPTSTPLIITSTNIPTSTLDAYYSSFVPDVSRYKNSFELVTQIGDGQIQAPATGSTLKAATNTAVPSSISAPRTSFSSYSLPSSTTHEATASLIIPSTSQAVTSSTQQQYSPTPINALPTSSLAAKSNSYALVTQINDGQIQAPIDTNDPMLAATVSLSVSPIAAAAVSATSANSNGESVLQEDDDDSVSYQASSLLSSVLGISSSSAASGSINAGRSVTAVATTAYNTYGDDDNSLAANLSAGEPITGYSDFEDASALAASLNAYYSDSTST